MNLVDVEDVNVSPVSLFDYRQVGEDYLLVNDFGDWLILSPSDFSAFLEGTLEPEGEVYADLRQGNFLSAHLDEKAAIEKLRKRYRCLSVGPRTFQIALNRDAYVEAELDIAVEAAVMADEVIERGLDLAFLSTDQTLELELCGADPLKAWDQLVHLVDYAVKRNRLALKDISITVVSDLDGMTQEKLEWLIEHNIGLRAMISTETLLGSDTTAIDWLGTYNQAVSDAGESCTANAAQMNLLCTPQVLGAYEKVLEVVRGSGCRAIRLITYDANQITAEDDGATGCELGSYLVFYGDVLDAMLSDDTSTPSLVELGAAAYLQRILDGNDGGGFELRNPTVDGIDRLGFSVEGLIFSSDAGRILYERRTDDIFLLGHVTRTGYRELVTHQTIRVLLIASVLECQPGWANSPYKVFGGSSPVRSYLEHGSVQGNMMDSPSVQEQVGILDTLFERLAAADSDSRDRLRAMVDAI